MSEFTSEPQAQREFTSEPQAQREFTSEPWAQREFTSEPQVQHAPVGLRAGALATLRGWQAPDAPQAALREAFLGFLLAREDSCARCCEAGHLTASALVLDASGERTLLTLHPRVGRWLQLGGHCEEFDATLREAALREAREESGIAGLAISAAPIHLDVHPVTCSLGMPTRHFDVRYLVRAPRGARPVRSAESKDLRWWPLDALPEGAGDLAALIAAAAP